MKIFTIASILFTTAIYGQSSQPPATPQELSYFHVVLLNLAESQSSLQRQQQEAHLAVQFGLSTEEVSAFDAATQQLGTLLQTIRQSLATNNSVAAVASLNSQRDQLITTLANQILNTVRPETSARLRVPARIVAAAAYGGGR